MLLKLGLLPALSSVFEVNLCILLVAVFTKVAVFGDTNLELPSFRSNRSVVEVHMDAGSNILSDQNNGLEMNIQLPLHARYQVSDERIPILPLQIICSRCNYQYELLGVRHI